MRVQLGACTNATAVTAEMCKCAIICCVEAAARAELALSSGIRTLADDVLQTPPKALHKGLYI